MLYWFMVNFMVSMMIIFKNAVLINKGLVVCDLIINRKR